MADAPTGYRNTSRHQTGVPNTSQGAGTLVMVTTGDQRAGIYGHEQRAATAMDEGGGKNGRPMVHI